MPILDQATIQIRSTSDDTGIKQTKNSINELNNTTDKSSTSFISMSSAVAVGQLAVEAITGTVKALTGTFNNWIKNASDVQNIRVNLDTLTGSAENGAKMFSELYEMAAKTPFETPELASATQMLLSYGMAQEDILPNLKILGDISMGNKEKFNGLTYAFSQVQSTGRLMGQDLQLMINRGFNPLTIISEKTGKSMSELKDEMSKGAISADMVKEAMIDATSEGGRFFGGMEAGSKTLSGLKSTFDDTIGMITRRIVGLSNTGDVVKGGLFDKLSTGLQQVNEWISNNSDKIDQWSAKIGDAVGNVASAFYNWIKDSLIPAIQTYWPVVQDTISKVIEFLSPMIKGLIDMGIQLSDIIGKYLGDNANAVVPILLGLGAVIFATTNPVMALATAISLLAGYIYTKWDDIKKWTEDLYNNIVGWFQNLPENLGRLAGEMVARVVQNFIDLPGQLMEIDKKIFSTITDGWNWLKDNWVNIVKQTIAEILLYFIKLPYQIIEQLQKAGTAISDFFSGFGQGFTTIISGQRANGGYVNAGSSYLVGERGPELFTATKSGYITPNNEINSNKITINQQNYINNQTDPIAIARSIGFELSRV